MHLELFPATLRARYKRFLADVALADDRLITVHCPNTGSMKNCVVPGSACWYSHSESKARKYPHTLEVVTTPGGFLAGINTARANALVAEAIGAGQIRELQGYSLHAREVVYGLEKSRIDFLLSGHAHDSRRCYLEVKNLTLMEEEGAGYFPDAISARGTKHLRELMAMVDEGHRAVLLFCVQHSGVRWVSPADHIDKLYGATLRTALAHGVEVLAYGVSIRPAAGAIELQHSLPLRI